MLGILGRVPGLLQVWAILVILWTLWVVRFFWRSARGDWKVVALFVLPSLLWPGAWIIAALSLGAKM